jgi:hypothetical protein
MKGMTVPAIVLLLGCAVAHGATLDNDSLAMCDRVFRLTPELRPSALMEAAAVDLDSGRFDRVYATFASRLDAALTTTNRTSPVATRLLANIRAGTLPPHAFDVVPSDDKQKEIIFESRADQIEIDCAQVAPHEPDMAAIAIMTGWVLGQQLLPALEARARFVARQSAAHQALLNNGLPMWPWELWLNGKRLGQSDWEPLFKTQWVLMRPTAGIEINTRSRAEGDLEASVAIEPLGLVRYRSDDYSKWWGASLVVTSSTREGIGLGALLRWNNLVLGVTRHQADSPAKSDGTFVFIGVELYQLITKKREDFETWKDLQGRRMNELLNGKTP